MINLKKEKPLLVIYSNYDALIYFVVMFSIVPCIIFVKSFWSENRNINLFILLCGISIFMIIVVGAIWLTQNWKVLKKQNIILWKSHIEVVKHIKIDYKDIVEIKEFIKITGKHIQKKYYIDAINIGNEFESLEFVKYFLSKNEASKHIKYISTTINDGIIFSKETVKEI